MKYDPKAANTLIPDGEYDLEFADAADETSKKGNEQIKITVRAYVNGSQRVVFDYVGGHNVWRLKQIAEATGQQEKFETGEMGAADIRGRFCRGIIKTQKDKTGEFQDKNVIARYLPPSAGASPNGQQSRQPGEDDDVRF